MHQRYLMNDTVAKQRVLGAIHAAPNGITFTTLAWITAEHGALRPARVRELARGYAHRRLIRIDDDVCYPTPKLTKEVAKWRAEKPATTPVKRDRGKATPEQRRLIVKAWRETPATHAEIAAQHGLHQSVVKRTIDLVVGPGEREVRRAERATLIRRQRREAFMEAVRRREAEIHTEAA